jgi:hypothetical protein
MINIARSLLTNHLRMDLSWEFNREINYNDLPYYFSTLVEVDKSPLRKLILIEQVVPVPFYWVRKSSFMYYNKKELMEDLKVRIMKQSIILLGFEDNSMVKSCSNDGYFYGQFYWLDPDRDLYGNYQQVLDWQKTPEVATSGAHDWQNTIASYDIVKTYTKNELIGIL